MLWYEKYFENSGLFFDKNTLKILVCVCDMNTLKILVCVLW